jgi:hypothetical protein
MTGHNRIPTKTPLITDAVFRELVVGVAVGLMVAFFLILGVIV